MGAARLSQWLRGRFRASTTSSALVGVLRISAAGSVLPLLIVVVWALTGAASGSWLLLPWWFIKNWMPGSDVFFRFSEISRSAQIVVDALSGFVLWWGLLHMALRVSWSQTLEERIKEETYAFIDVNKTPFQHPDELTASVNALTATEWIPRRAVETLTGKFSLLTQLHLLTELQYARIGPLLICTIATALLFSLFGLLLSFVVVAAVGFPAIVGVLEIRDAVSERATGGAKAAVLVGSLKIGIGLAMVYTLYLGVQWSLVHSPILPMLIPATVIAVMIVIGIWGESSLGYGSFVVPKDAIRDAVSRAGLGR